METEQRPMGVRSDVQTLVLPIYLSMYLSLCLSTEQSACSNAHLQSGRSGLERVCVASGAVLGGERDARWRHAP